jgi:hypothetical protein
MKRLSALRGKPESITTDNGSEFVGRAMETWAYERDVRLVSSGQVGRTERVYRELSMVACGMNV